MNERIHTRDVSHTASETKVESLLAVLEEEKVGDRVRSSDNGVYTYDVSVLVWDFINEYVFLCISCWVEPLRLLGCQRPIKNDPCVSFSHSCGFKRSIMRLHLLNKNRRNRINMLDNRLG